MRILCIDVGTGTQDIYLFDSRLDPENGFKLVVPAPTMMVHRHLKEATRRGQAVALTGVTMGGGPSQWAADDHLRAGHVIYATPQAARSFNDDLDKLQAKGITILSEDEIARLPDSVARLKLRDFDFSAISRAFAQFGVSLNDLAAVAVSAFDHGAAPPDVSDRQFRFDYITRRINIANRLSSFAFKAGEVPPEMTRLQAVVASAEDVDAPLVVMDSASAAVQGALFDPVVAARDRLLVANVGNMHTLAFKMKHDGQVEGVFEHHTGLLDQPKLEGLLGSLAAGTIQHADVFGEHGHGAVIFDPTPLSLSENGFGVAVTGPRQTMMRGSALRPYFAAPFGDMMIAGCFGLLASVADVLPELGEPIRASLNKKAGSDTAPWDVE